MWYRYRCYKYFIPMVLSIVLCFMITELGDIVNFTVEPSSGSASSITILTHCTEPLTELGGKTTSLDMVVLSIPVNSAIGKSHT